MNHFTTGHAGANTLADTVNRFNCGVITAAQIRDGSGTCPECSGTMARDGLELFGNMLEIRFQCSVCGAFHRVGLALHHARAVING